MCPFFCADGFLKKPLSCFAKDEKRSARNAGKRAPCPDLEWEQDNFVEALEEKHNKADETRRILKKVANTLPFCGKKQKEAPAAFQQQ